MSLDQEHLKSPRQSGDSGVQGASSDPELVPGKRTRAMGLSGNRAPGQASQAQPVTDALAIPGNMGYQDSSAAWDALAVRPDLHGVPGEPQDADPAKILGNSNALAAGASELSAIDFDKPLDFASALLGRSAGELASDVEAQSQVRDKVTELQGSEEFQQLTAVAANEESPKAPEAKKVVRTITILVHGVNTDAAWYDLVQEELKKNPETKNDIAIPFTWGDYENQKQGGYPQYAVDEVDQMFQNPTFGYDRFYQGHSAARLKEMIDAARETGAQVNVVAHSNGTALTTAALMMGAELDNMVFMGSPLDSDNDKSNAQINKAAENVKGDKYNFWSEGDEWAWIKGGIGANGDNKTWNKKNPDFKNVEFGPGKNVAGTKITEKEVDHSDYMLEEHMPIISKYIDQFGDKSSGPVDVSQDKLDALKAMGDWTERSEYKNKKNVDGSSPLLEKYSDEIADLKKVKK